MKTNAERAQERLTLTPKTEFTLKKDDFIGALYQPERDEYPGKAVLWLRGQGFEKKKGIQQLECSAFSWRGEELSWARTAKGYAYPVRASVRLPSL